MHPHVQRLFAAEHGVVARRHHLEFAGQLDHARRTGEVVAPLPGVYALLEVAPTIRGRALAAARWSAAAVVTGRAAAQLTFWPALPVAAVELAQVDARRRRAGFTLSARRISPELILQLGPVRVTEPALTALDLSLELGGDPIDTALRDRRATLAGMRRALDFCPGRTGNRIRRQLLLDSRDEPWSAAERRAHRLLRAGGITGWKANRPIIADGRRYFVDILFRAARLVVEIDGREFHDGPGAFECDRARQNALVAAGWRVLRFTWRMLCDEPDLVLSLIRGELARIGS